MGKTELSPYEISLQEDFIRDNNVMKIEAPEDKHEPYTGELHRQVHYRKNKSSLGDLFQPQCQASRNYGGAEHSSGVN